MNDYFKKKQPNSGNNNNNDGNKTPNQKNGNGNNFGGGKSAPSWIFIVLALVAALVFFKPFTIINSGEVGIKVNTGKYEKEPLSAGLKFYIPIIQRIIIVNTRMRQIIYSNENNTMIGDDYGSRSSLGGENPEGAVKHSRAIPVLDKRGLTVNIDLAVQYRLRAEAAPTTSEQWGSSWEEKIINSKVREVVRDVIGQYAAENFLK